MRALTFISLSSCLRAAHHLWISHGSTLSATLSCKVSNSRKNESSPPLGRGTFRNTTGLSLGGLDLLLDVVFFDFGFSNDVRLIKKYCEAVWWVEGARAIVHTTQLWGSEACEGVCSVWRALWRDERRACDGVWGVRVVMVSEACWSVLLDDTWILIEKSLHSNYRFLSASYT